MKRNAVIIYNPRSGAHRRRDRPAEVADFAAALAKHDLHAEPWGTTGPGVASELAQRAVASGVDLVIASGGDGTLNEVLQGMAGSQIPLAIWPTGTANVLARDLKLPTQPSAIIPMIVAGRERRIALGRANERYFFLMAGIGLDASIIQGVNPAFKARAGEGAFWVSGFQHLVAWRPQRFSLEINDATYEGAFAVIGNSTGYGGGFRITPHASLDEAMLDVCIFPSRRFAWQYMRNVMACKFGDPTRCGALYHKTQTVVARPCGESSVWVQVDGELLAPLPMRFEAVPDALTVIVPAEG